MTIIHIDQEGILMVEDTITGGRASHHMIEEVPEGEDTWTMPVHRLTLFTQPSHQ